MSMDGGNGGALGEDLVGGKGLVGFEVVSADGAGTGSVGYEEGGRWLLRNDAADQGSATLISKILEPVYRHAL